MSARSIMLLLPVAGLLAALGSACGSTSEAEDLFGNPGNFGGGGGSTATTTSSATTATGSTTASTSASTGSAGGEGGAGTTTSTTTTTTTTGPGSDVVVFCAGSPCMAGQVCCFHLENSDLDACGDAGACGPNTITLSCNGPEDCPGGVCCGDYNGNGYDGVSCEPTCEQGLTMCAGMPLVCGPGQQCLPSNYLGQGYAYCE
jgi:hypothetical protein